MFYLVLFIVAVGVFAVLDRRKAKADFRAFRAMTPADLKALYDGGGSLGVPTRFGKIAIPLMKAAAVTLAVYVGSIIATVLRSSGV